MKFNTLLLLVLITFGCHHLIAMDKQQVDLYDFLKVPPSAPQEHIEFAYQYIKKIKGLPEQYLTMLSSAYVLLIEPQIRAKYDQEGYEAAARFYSVIDIKRRAIIQEQQQRLGNLLAENSLKTKKKLTKKIMKTNTNYLKLKAKRKDPFYHDFLNDAINTNIYRLAFYHYTHNNCKQAYNILNRHMVIASQKNGIIKEMEQLKEECYKIHCLNVQQSKIAF